MTNELKSLEFYLNELNGYIKSIHYKGKKLDKQDLQQEMMLSIVQSYRRLENGEYNNKWPNNVTSFLRSRCYGALKDYLSQNAHEFSFSSHSQYDKHKDDLPSVTNSYEEVDSYLSNDHEKLVVNEILDKFDKDNIIRDRMDGLTFREIGEQQGISASGVFQKVNKIKKSVQEFYIRNFPDKIMSLVE